MIPKAINMSVLFEVRQDFKETPTEFMNHLKDTAWKYINIDPEMEEGKNNPAPIFVRRSWDDIRMKLRKIRGTDTFDTGKLLDIPWAVKRWQLQKESAKDS